MMYVEYSQHIRCYGPSTISHTRVDVAYKLTRLIKMLILLVTTLLATTLMSSQNKEDPVPLEQVILTGATDNSTGEEDTASEELLVDLQEQEWVGDAVKDIAYYLRAHKFNDFDRRWFTRADDATTKLYSKFPDPALRTLHWEVKKHCMADFISCVQYLQEKILQAELVRKDDTVTVMVDQGWTLPHNKTQVDLVDQDCQKLYRLDWVGAQPFLGPLERFQWRTSASYFMCWYTMQEIPVLAMFQEACDNFASCLDPWYGPFNHDPRADDRLPYQCAFYSFCPDPCCPEKYYDSLNKCWDSEETNPCYQEAPEDERTCTLERRDNTDLLNIILNMWNVSCVCKHKGFEWSSRYRYNRFHSVYHWFLHLILEAPSRISTRVLLTMSGSPSLDSRIRGLADKVFSRVLASSN
uniref:Uncharacterized protein n=1 Tax=Timema cristinae TaxID=61476 RepID=A0A7R9CXN8_TIMCR|nr:unnamed protein product [Timema cristinae]